MPKEDIETKESPVARYNNTIKALNAAHAKGELNKKQYVEFCAEADGCRLAEEASDGGLIQVGNYLRGTLGERSKGEEYMTGRNNYFLDGFGFRRDELGGKNILHNKFGLPDTASLKPEELVISRNVLRSLVDAARVG